MAVEDISRASGGAPAAKTSAPEPKRAEEAPAQEAAVPNEPAAKVEFSSAEGQESNAS